MQAGLGERHRRQLLDCAYATLRHVAKKGRAPNVEVATFAMPLRALRKTFVTLEVDGKLRGCVGSLAPVDALISDVVKNTYKAAMQDKRFKPMVAEELGKARVTISILSHPRLLPFASEADLVDRLRPEIDGLAIQGGGRRALFLPKVWEEIVQPAEILSRLKRKAGMPSEPLSPEVRAFRFTAETFTGDDRDPQVLAPVASDAPHQSLLTLAREL
jgi:MEMO1 family protein